MTHSKAVKTAVCLTAIVAAAAAEAKADADTNVHADAAWMLLPTP